MGTYDTLHSKMRTLIRQGVPVNVAAAQAQREYELTGPAPHRDLPNIGPIADPHPTGEQLQEALRRDMRIVQKMYKDFKPSLLDNPEAMERRYAYSQKCRNIVAKIASESAHRDQIFEETSRRLFKDAFGDKVQARISARRWMWQLIDLGDTPEAKYHNEEVVSLVMLAESRSNHDVENGERIFRETRSKHYTDNMGLSPEEAARRADDDLKNGLNRLMELTMEVVDRQFITKDEANKARDAILSGEADKQPGGLEAAYRKIINPGGSIGWNMPNVIDDFHDFGMEISEQMYQEKFRPYMMNSTATHNATIQQMANPFYAIMDGADIINAGGTLLPSRAGEAINFSAFQDFSADGATGIGQTRVESVSRALQRFALKMAQDVTLRNKPNDINIYSNGRGRTVILLTDQVSIDNGFRMNISPDVPGRLVNHGFDDKMKALQEKSVAHDKLFRSSGQYRAMKRALNALAETKLPDNPTEQQVKDFADKLKAVQDAAKVYNERKAQQLQERGADKGKDDYEQARINFGKELKDYADQMAKRIGLVQEHIDTMKRVIRTEQLEEEALRQGQMSEPDPNVSPFQRSVKLEDDIFEAQERAKAAEAERAKEEQARREAEERRLEEEQNAVVGTKLDQAFHNAEKNLNMDNLPDDLGRGAGPTLRDAMDKTKTAYETAVQSGDAAEANRLGRELLATMAVNEMVKCSYGHSSKLGDRFRNLAECGGLETMKSQVMEHDKFTSRTNGADFSNRQTFTDLADTTASIVGRQVVKEVMAAMKQAHQNQKKIGENLNAEKNLGDKQNEQKQQEQQKQKQQQQQQPAVMAGPQ